MPKEKVGKGAEIVSSFPRQTAYLRNETHMKPKTVIVLSVIAAVIAADLFIFIAQETEYKETVRFYRTDDAFGCFFYKTASVDDVAYMDVDCDFILKRNLIYGVIKGTLTYNGKEHHISSAGVHSELGYPMAAIRGGGRDGFPVGTLETSSNNKYIRIIMSESTDAAENGCWLGGFENDEEFLEMATDFYGDFVEYKD